MQYQIINLKKVNFTLLFYFPLFNSNNDCMDDLLISKKSTKKGCKKVCICQSIINVYDLIIFCWTVGLQKYTHKNLLERV